METTCKHEVEWTLEAPGSSAGFVTFLEENFDGAARGRVRETFPNLLDSGSDAVHFAGWIDGQIVVAAVGEPQSWLIADSRIEVAAMGCFVTRPQYRRLGLSSRLKIQMLDWAAAQKLDWAVLFSDRAELYCGRGFVAAGSEHHVCIADAVWPELGTVDMVRRARPGDEAALLAMYSRHALRRVRGEHLFEVFLASPTAEIWILERDARPTAYVAVGKGADFPNWVHEYGGDPGGVRVLLGHVARIGATHALVPAGAGSFFEGISGLSGVESPVALVRALDQSKLPHELPWAVWGFDSV